MRSLPYNAAVQRAPWRIDSQKERNGPICAVRRPLTEPRSLYLGEEMERRDQRLTKNLKTPNCGVVLAKRRAIRLAVGGRN